MIIYYNFVIIHDFSISLESGLLRGSELVFWLCLLPSVLIFFMGCRWCSYLRISCSPVLPLLCYFSVGIKERKQILGEGTEAGTRDTE